MPPLEWVGAAAGGCPWRGLALGQTLGWVSRVRETHAGFLCLSSVAGMSQDIQVLGSVAARSSNCDRRRHLGG